MTVVAHLAKWSCARICATWRGTRSSWGRKRSLPSADLLPNQIIFGPDSLRAAMEGMARRHQ